MNDILLKYEIDYSLSTRLDNNILITNRVLPIREEELSIYVAISTQENENTKIMNLFSKPVKFIVVEKSELDKELQYLEFKQLLHTFANDSIQHIHKENENSYIISFMEELFSFSIEHNVSDIHFESLDTSIIIRVRIDGELNQIFRFNNQLYPLISSIIKYLGNLDISQRRKPLNGRFTTKIRESNYDMRISTLPTIHGESIVLRILDNGNIQKDINSIGFHTDTLNIIKKSIQLNQGLVLVTGPTGSGKTTTLYSMLSSINKKNKKIITIEDPVEYKLDGVMQVNINNEISLNYKEVLKNILRQDPDILLIGEIRDSESLQIAMQASLTGHLVIATLHTNSARETITRLLDLNAKPYLIASTLKIVLSQRLVRKLCESCKVEDEISNYYISQGCKHCNFTGYKDRTVVSEVLSIDSKIAAMISENKNIHEIKNYIDTLDFKTIQQNTMQLVKEGTTTLEEYYSKV
jgi:general secretion pathway protein E